MFKDHLHSVFKSKAIQSADKHQTSISTRTPALNRKGAKSGKFKFRSHTIKARVIATKSVFKASTVNQFNASFMGFECTNKFSVLYVNQPEENVISNLEAHISPKNTKKRLQEKLSLRVISRGMPLMRQLSLH